MLLAEVEHGRADEIADIFDEEDRAEGGFELLEGVARHMRIEMTAPAGVNLKRRRARRANALGVHGRLLIAFDHADWKVALQPLDGFHEKCGFAGAWTRDKVERKNASHVERDAVVSGMGVVLCEQILLDFHDTRFTVAVRVLVMMVVIIVVVRVVRMIVIMPMRVMVAMMTFDRLAVAGLNARLAVSASANSAHQSTSSSLIRISSPPVACT
jgi:hypothetical protein